ncbi:MAG: chemotaxis-specific protein-glutamate methyltransferase CheB [Myxococcales bacterium]
MTRSAPIRVLIADDSATVRTALAELLSADKGLLVVGQARDGVEAVALARTLHPDVITMDVNMPRLDGLGATAAIMAETPSRVLVVCSVSEQSQMDLSFKAMAAGALELLPKPAAGPRELRKWGERVAESVRLMAEVPVVRRIKRFAMASGAASPVVRAPPPAPARLSRPMRSHIGHVDAVGVVASTGGPPALATLLSTLPAGLTVPVLIAQHIAEGFTAGLIRWFASVAKLPVRLAVEGAQALPGHVYLPPDGLDLEIDSRGVLHTPKAVSMHTPSGNRLLLSLARAYGVRAFGVVLTGMGDDGALGLLAIRKAGGSTLAQDEATSVVYGMPQAAHALGAAQQVVPLDSIAPLIVELCREADLP